MPGFLYVDDLPLYGEFEDLRTMVKLFVEVCRRGLKVNAGKSKVMLLGGKDGMKCEVYMDRNILDVVWTNQVQMIENVERR